MHNPAVVDILTKSLIFGLIQTHHTSDDIGKLHIDKYKCHSVCRPKPQNVKRFKPLGGLAVYVHESIQPGVSFMSEAGTESIFIQLKKEYFNFSSDIFVCFAYLVPSTSKVIGREYMPDDIFEDISSKLAKYNDQGHLLLLGDLNSRTQNLCDFLQDADEDHSGTSDFPRNSFDEASPNTYGRKFIDMCREVPLRILNGRFLGDFMGNFTCVQAQGMSVVDYGAASPDILQYVHNFSVHHPVPALSDHCPISVSLKIRAKCSFREQQEPLLPKPDKVKWVKGMSDTFTNIMQSGEVRKVLNNFVTVGIMPDQASIDLATSLRTNIMVTAARQAGMQVKRGALPRRQAWEKLGFQKLRARQPRWYGTSCHQAFNAVKATAALLRNDPRNAWLRGKLCTETKDYKRVVKKSQKAYIDSIYEDLESINRSDPKGHMDLVKTLKEGTFDKNMPSDTAGITPDSWLNHFKELLGKTLVPAARDQEMGDHVLKNVDAFQTELDQPFTHDELKRSLKSLKNNKASSFDLVCNER